MSTVGYGDLSVAPEESPRWLVFIGALYQILAVVVAVLAFSAAADSAFSPLGNFWEKLFDKIIGPPDPTAFLYKRVRRVKAVKLGEIFVQFFALILFGVLVSRIWVQDQWTWMDSFYW